MNIGKFSVNNPVLVNILMVAILVMGGASFLRLPQELFSDVSFNWVIISVPYPGVAADEIEKSLAIKIEDEISDVDRIKKIDVVCRESFFMAMVQFEDNVSKDEFARLYQDLRAEFDKVPLPEGTLDPYVDDFSSSDFLPIMQVVLTGTAGEKELNRIARELRDKILDINDVSKADLIGNREREITIHADRRKLEAFKLPLSAISDAIRAKNVNIPGGELESGSATYLLRTLEQMKELDDFNNVILRTSVNGGVIRLSDVARIGDGFAESDYDVRYNGKPAISLLISKNLRGNAIDIGAAIHTEVEDFRKGLPAGLDIKIVNDTNVYIKDSLSNLGWNSVFGFLFLVLVLLVFLGIRNAILTAIGIPLAFAITFIIMEMMGETLNGSSLFALVLVLGMIVDHAIVIIENGYRYVQEGLSPRDAAIRGTNEVVLPVLAATGTTVAAFLPLMILPGTMGKFLRIIPLVVSIALIASTLEALLFLPSHFVEWGGKVKQKGRGFIGRWQDAFKRFILKVYKRRYLSMGIALVVILASFALLGLVKQDLFGGEEMPMFYVDIQMPPGTPRSETDRVTRRFEEKLLSLVGNGEVKSVTAAVGFQEGETEWLTQSNVAQLTVGLEERKDGRERPALVIADEVQDLIRNIPGAEVVKARLLNNGPPQDKPVSFRIDGDNYNDMASIAADYTRMLAGYPELFNITDNFDPGGPELHIKVNDERAAALGLAPALIGMYIRTCFEGSKVTTYFDEDEEIDVILKLAAPYRTGPEDVLQLKLPTPDGRFIPFSSVCTLEPARGMAVIRRIDRKRSIQVEADARDKTRLKKIIADIKDTFDKKYAKAFPGISLHIGGEYAEWGNLLGNLARLFGVGIFLMYLILGAQFKSFFQPFIMGLTIFFALVGCILYLVISGTPLSILVMYAVIALAGIAVNDSIVLISFINSLRRKGMALGEAVAEGAAVRLRPIILTSVTTISGLIPMAIGLGGQSETWMPMASTIIFGLFFSTAGTLVVIPCAYAILDDITRKFGGKMQLEGD